MLFQHKNKKGVSEIIGYVLLIVFAVIMGAIVYTWLRTYVPTEPLACPDSVSLFIQDANYCGNQLNLTISNNGRFDVAGYFILATNSSDQQLATIDLSPYLSETYGGKKFGNSILFLDVSNNSLKTGNQTKNVFDISSQLGTLSSVQIVPAIFQVQDNRNRFVSCSGAKVIEKNLACKIPCVPENIATTCGTAICGKKVNNCGQTVTCPPDNCEANNLVCDGNGHCALPIYNCGNGRLDSGEQCDDGNTTAGDGCSGTCTIESGYTCNNTVQPSVCTPICGDGIIISPETCDQGSGNIANGDGCSSTCRIETGYTCSGTPSVCTPICGNGIVTSPETCDPPGLGCSSSCQIQPGYTCSGQPSVCNGSTPSCPNTCVSLGYSLANSGCTSSAGTCTSNGGTHVSSGDQYCTGGPQADTCCCKH